MTTQDITVIEGPVLAADGIIYQVTLQSGAIMTRASEFEPEPPPIHTSPVISETGQILRVA